MRVLFLHPEDSPSAGPWADSRWDLIVDLGFASRETYEEWGRDLGASFLSIYQFAGQAESFQWVNQVLDQGRGQLLDHMGLDWWEILAVASYQELQALYLLNQLRPEIDGDAIELAASRSHQFARAAEAVLGRRIRYFELESRSPLGQVGRMFRAARKLRPAQISEIAFDKWDSSYRIRRRVTGHNRARLADGVVLLPSAYSNVTRTALSYAAQLPHRQFLLATTRSSAVPARLPGNVTATVLAAYARPSRATRAESEELKQAWQIFLRSTVEQVQELRQAASAGWWDRFPRQLENGLRLREAWKHLLQSEPVQGVLCGDDLNYYTRLPMLLGSRSGIPAVYCSHGALDGGFVFKMPTSDVYLVKGEMERDYLQRVRPIEPEKIRVAAPGASPAAVRDPHTLSHGDVVFFSQPYEVENGRTEAIYRELLPRLLAVAQRCRRKLVIKLHPFESKQARRALVNSILPKQSLPRVQIVSQTPVEDVMARAWCGIAIDSSVAVECTLRGIPFFLCGWLDFMGLGYLRQFARFGAGQVLDSPEKIDLIPEMVEAYKADPAVLQRLWQMADPVELEQILFRSRQSRFPAREVPHALEQSEAQESTARAAGSRQPVQPSGFQPGAAIPFAASPSPSLAASPSASLTAPARVLPENRRTRLNKSHMWPTPTQLMHRMVYPALASVGYFHSRASADVNVITYHGILPADYQRTDDFLDGALIGVQAFRSQLQLLKKHYNVISPEQLLAWLRQQESLPERAVVLTCDDGLLNHLTGVLPVLQEEGLKCLFFVTASFQDDLPSMHWYTELYLLLRDAPKQDGPALVQGITIPRLSDNLTQRRSLWVKLEKRLSRLGAMERRAFMDEAAGKLGLPPEWLASYLEDPVLRNRFQKLRSRELKQLADAGMTIGAHTLSHPTLSEQSAELAHEEIFQCRAALERCLGRTVWAFAYPFGDPASAGAREYRMTEEAGYECAFLNVGRTASELSRFSFPRIHVTSEMSLTVYEAHVSGVHDALRSRLRRNRKVM
jgi:peptidoglycan/xylan/chitin deacetylase (PgdA/CDA1 family)